jgi:uncharacterized protein (DUF2345 family)
MALIPSSRYPAQTDSGDPGYPYGRARNAGSYNDGTGTPNEQDRINDIFGFQQALLVAAGITPSGTPDKVGASQYLTALSTIAHHILSGGTLTVDGGGKIDLASNADLNVLSGADVTVAAGGEISVSGTINLDSGGHIDVDANANINLAGNSDLNLASGADINVAIGGEINVSGTINVDGAGHIDVDSGAAINLAGLLSVSGEIQFNSGSVLDVNSSSDFASGTTLAMHGQIDVTSGGSIDVTSADLNINAGGQLQLNGGSLIVGATGHIYANGGDITLGPGSTLTVDAGQNLAIDDAPEGFRLTLTPAFNDSLEPWRRTTDASGLLGWYQSDVDARRSIWFALPVNPGDTVVDVYVRLDGSASGSGHGGTPPATQPTVELISVDLGGALTVEASIDDSAVGAGYDLTHDVVLAGVAGMPYLATADPIYIRIRGEFGAGTAVPGLTLLSISGNLIARSYRAANMVR